MDAPSVSVNEWIRVGNEDALVFRVHSPDSLYIGYYQNKLKAIGEDVVWDDDSWKFKNDGPNGTYLRGSDEAAVKRGPRDSDT